MAMKNQGNTVEQQLKIFEEIEKYFIGKKATLFAYSPGFRDIYILFDLQVSFFVIKFMFVEYAKIEQNWNFREIKKKYKDSNKSCIIFSDKSYFEIHSHIFSIYEITNFDNSDKLIFSIKGSDLVLVENDISLKRLLNYSSSSKACVYRYERWNNILILEISNQLNSTTEYLVLYGCKKIEFYPETEFDTHTTICSKRKNYLRIQNKYSKFYVEFSHIQKLNDEEFYEYNMNLYDFYGYDKGVGQKILVQSTENFFQKIMT